MKSARRAKIWLIISIIAIVLVSGTLGFFVGRGKLTLVTILRNKKPSPSVNINLFWEAYNKLKENYASDVDGQKYLYGSIEGGFASLGDPYTMFFTPDQTKDFTNELSGELEGIGVKIGVLDDYPAVIAPLDGSPAQKAGLKPRDKIIKVDGVDMKGVSLDEAVTKIRGQEGTKVKLEILRDGEKDTKTFEIERAKLQVKTVEVKYLDDVAVIELNEFGEDTVTEFSKAAKEISDKKINKVIIDLRSNPGGLLDGAVGVGNEIFPKDTTVVIEKGKTTKNEMKTNQDGVLKDAKLVVLVNDGSASAAEILAGAVQDNKRGTIIGGKTFGKGTVQQFEPLSDGSAVKITVAQWLTPSGKSIEKNGITPDIEIKDSDNPYFDNNDPLIERAIQELNK